MLNWHWRQLCLCIHVLRNTVVCVVLILERAGDAHEPTCSHYQSTTIECTKQTGIIKVRRTGILHYCTSTGSSHNYARSTSLLNPDKLRIVHFGSKFSDGRYAVAVCTCNILAWVQNQVLAITIQLTVLFDFVTTAHTLQCILAFHLLSIHLHVTIVIIINAASTMLTRTLPIAPRLRDIEAGNSCIPNSLLKHTVTSETCQSCYYLCTPA